MKYIKLFEDKEYDKSIIKSNKKLIDLVYIIMSLEEDLRNNEFFGNKYQPRKKEELQTTFNIGANHGQGWGYNTEAALKYIDENIDIEIGSIHIILSCFFKSSYTGKTSDLEELNQLIIGLKQRVSDFSPNTRVDKIGKIVEIKDIEKFESGEVKELKQIKIELRIELLDKKSTRYT